MWGSEELLLPGSQSGSARPPPSTSAGASVLFFPLNTQSQSRGTGFVFKKVFILWEMKLGLVLGQGLREALRGEKKRERG